MKTHKVISLCPVNVLMDGEMIETEDTTDKEVLIPMEGYPGQQEHQTCDECDGELEITEVIWESHDSKRVSLKCSECGDITVTEKSNRMFRYKIDIKREG